jgi:hypothetical protein
MLLKLLRLIAVTACLAGALPPASSAQEGHSTQSRDSKSQAANFAGCYKLQIGRWWPWSLGEDAKFVTPPNQFELTLQQATKGFAKGQLIVRQHPSGERPWRISYWILTGARKAAVIWSDGLSGVSINFTKHDDELRGWAHAHFDFWRPPHIRHVTARRIACQAVQ